MKIITKNWITSIIGIVLLILGGTMLWYEKDTVASVLAFAMGTGLIFSKDTLVKKLIGKV